MESIKLEVTGNIAKVTQKPQRITAGTVGMPVEFTFDDHWDGLDRIAVFQAGHVRKNMVLVENATAVPMEVLATPGPRLNIGVYGVNKDGSVAIPTIWANAGQIREGATPGDGAGSDIGIAKKYYDKAMLAADQAIIAAADADSAARQAVEAAISLDITCFGEPYANAVCIIPLDDDEFVNMYLFATTDGYDAVVTGEGAIYNYTENAEREYDMQKISRMHIESGVTSIGDYFMYKAFNLKHLSFADSKAVTHLGERAFAYTQICGEYDFSGLQDATINNVFEACPKLEGLTFNGNVTTIAKKAFQFCLALRYVNGISNVTNIGEAALQYCTCLEHIDVVPANVTLGNWAFILTPNEAVIKGTDTALKDAVWKSTALMPFAQNEWEGTQIETPIENRPAIVSLPIPETDNQKADFYKGAWMPFLQPYIDKGAQKIARNRVTGGCFFFSLFHVYNIMHPNAQYDTFYDFIMNGITPNKIKITASVRSALTESEVWDALMAWHATNATGITYEEGTEVSVLDLPLCLDFYNRDYVQEGTFFWGMRQVLGWEATELLFNDDASRGQPIKETILDELANGRPVIMEIVGASSYDDPNCDGVFGDGEGHAMHAVTAIGYDKATDKLLIVDSTWEYPSDIVPMVYWLPFEALITPDKASAVWTFEFKEVTMVEIDEKLGTLLAQVNSGFHVVTGKISLSGLASSGAAERTLPASLPLDAKMLILEASDEVLNAIEGTAASSYSVARIKFIFAGELSPSGSDAVVELKPGGANGKSAGAVGVVTIVDTNTDGVADSIRVKTYAFQDGTYNWKAYHWNE